MTMVSTLVNALADAPQLVVLTGLLMVAAWIDIRHHKVPNLLVLVGLGFVIAFHGLQPAVAHGNGWLAAASG